MTHKHVLVGKTVIGSTASILVIVSCTGNDRGLMAKYGNALASTAAAQLHDLGNFQYDFPGSVTKGLGVVVGSTNMNLKAELVPSKPRTAGIRRLRLERLMLERLLVARETWPYWVQVAA